jgi:hypothetical protein
MRRLTGGPAVGTAAILFGCVLAATEESLASLQQTGRWETSVIALGTQATHIPQVPGGEISLRTNGDLCR